MRLSLLALSAAALAAGCASTPPEQDPVQLKLNDLDGRVARMERIAANQVEAAQRLDEVQGNLRELRGRIEELEHNNEALSKQQRDLYSDLDKRLAATGGAAGAAGASAAARATAPAPAAGAEAPAAGAGSANAAGSPDTAGGAAPSSTEQAVYNQAFEALKARSYSVAIAGFKDFLG